jgi:hypothetical protein
VTDFVNLKIKSVQSFGDYKGRVYVHVFIWLSVRTCMNIYVCNILKRGNLSVRHFLFMTWSGKHCLVYFCLLDTIIS